MSERTVAFYGDDFTGSVDVLLQFARRGWSGRLFTTLPDAETLARTASEVDAVGVAGIARSLPTPLIEAELRPVLEAFRALAPTVVQYKACSTADSSPTVGSLGRVAEIGRDVFGAEVVPVLFAQPDFGRYTVFGHHFASEDGVVHRLDRQPTMSRHPSTPMRESDLARHLGEQTELSVGSLAHLAYGELRERLTTGGADLVVLDALDEDHLRVVGAAVLALPGTTFAIGSGGLSHGIAAADPGAAAQLPPATPRRGPVLAVSGSRSPQTRRQLDAAASAGWLVRPLPLGADRGPVIAEALEALGAGRSVALGSDDADTTGIPSERLLETIAEAAADVVRAAASADLTRRIVVCGGDTSSRITRLLGVTSLSIAANPWGNVVLLRAHSADPAIDGRELLLKGGQVGAVSLLPDVDALDV